MTIALVDLSLASWSQRWYLFILPMPEKSVILALLTSFSLGLLHSLEPSHAKVVLASYFLNHRRTVREAIAFALTVTLAHTLTIFTLALVGFLIGPLFKGQAIENWSEVTGGILMCLIAGWMFVSEAKAHFHKKNCCGHQHHAGHDHSHGHFFHHHDYNHDHPKPSSLKQIFILGFCSGAVPCMSGLTVLINAWSYHSPATGLMLVTVFSIGLGGVVLAMCLLMRHMASILDAYWKKSADWSRFLPTVSSMIIFLMGVYVLWEGYAKLGR